MENRVRVVIIGGFKSGKSMVAAVIKSALSEHTFSSIELHDEDTPNIKVVDEALENVAVDIHQIQKIHWASRENLYKLLLGEDVADSCTNHQSVSDYFIETLKKRFRYTTQMTNSRYLDAKKQVAQYEAYTNPAVGHFYSTDTLIKDTSVSNKLMDMLRWQFKAKEFTWNDTTVADLKHISLSAISKARYCGPNLTNELQLVCAINNITLLN